MTERLDAQKVVDNVVTALDTEDDTASAAMFRQVNEELKTLSAPEQNYVANELSLKGLLPNVAIETGLVKQDDYITKDALAKVATDEGSGTVNGMAAKFLSDNFAALGGGPRTDTNSDYVEGFDFRYDLALQTAQAKREFGGLLDVLKGQNPDNADIQSRDGLQQGDIDSLLAKPELLSADQKQALDTMKANFEMMKTPRGIWTIADWTTPRINETSLNEFVGTGAPMGMYEHLRIAEAEKSKQAGLEAAARQAQAERTAKPPEVAPVDVTPPVVAQEQTPPAEVPQPELPPGQTNPPSLVDVIDPNQPPIKGGATEGPAVIPTPGDTTTGQAEAPPVPPEQAEVPPVPPEQAEVPPVPPEQAEVPPVPPAQAEVPPVPPAQAEVPPVPPEQAEVPPEAPKPEETMERDKLTDKEYTVVSGDNLWKIARAHLAELEGKRPSNADVLNLVNEIVKRNNIRNPNLIYPDQKFIIPGPAAAPPAPAAPTEPATN